MMRKLIVVVGLLFCVMLWVSSCSTGRVEVGELSGEELLRGQDALAVEDEEARSPTGVWPIRHPFGIHLQRRTATI